MVKSAAMAVDAHVAIRCPFQTPFVGVAIVDRRRRPDKRPDLNVTGTVVSSRVESPVALESRR